METNLGGDTKKKRRMLLCWWYDRPDLMKPFLELLDVFDITVLFYRFQEQEELNSHFPCKRIFWTEFKSPYDILDQEDPDIVAFMGIENSLTLALLLGSKNRGIATCYIAHGVTTGFEKKLRNEKSLANEMKPLRYQTNNPAYLRNKTHSVKFLLNVLRPGNLSLALYILKFIWVAHRYNSIGERLLHTVSDNRLADKYIVYSKRLGRLLIERDQVADDRFIQIGPYGLDSLIQKLTTENAENPLCFPFFLLIDQPISILTWEERLKFFQKLARAAFVAGRVLVIKIHPAEYQTRDFPVMENIKYVKDDIDIADLVKSCDGCYGYYSALLLPILYYKKCILFQIAQNELVQEWADIGIAKMLQYNSFSIEEANFDSFEVSKEARKSYLATYLIASDGKGIERLRSHLITLASK